MPYKDKGAQAAYQAGYIAAVRKMWFEKNGPCVKCGSWESLELDHIERAEKESHRIWSWARERRDAELAKCQVLCRSCHAAKTLEQNGGPSPHGTRHRYNHHRCRCDLCRAANTTSMRARKQRALERANSSGVARTPDLVIMSDAL